MKWGRRKKSSPPSSSSRPFSISRVFPVSWFSKFKQIGGGSRPPPERLDSRCRKSSWHHEDRRRFYGGGDDGLWRLSFGETDDLLERRDASILRSILYESSDELELPFSSCRSCRPSSSVRMEETGEFLRFNNMVSDVRKTRELHGGFELLQGNGTRKGGKETKCRTPRQESVKDRKSRKANRRVFKEKWSEFDAAEKSAKSVEKHILEPKTISRIRTRGDHSKSTFDPREHRDASSMHLSRWNLGTIEENPTFASLEWEDTAATSNEEKKKLKEMAIREIISKGQSHRKSIHVSRELQSRTKQRSKIRVHSPRTPSKGEICKIKALEDKKSKMKMKKIKERIVGGKTQIESFAVVTCSFDPQKDFRDSMIEMIEEKGISQPEELEELLACYLMLNSDEYHDLIIKVFRQVWFSLNRAQFDPELQNEHSYQ